MEPDATRPTFRDLEVGEWFTHCGIRYMKMSPYQRGTREYSAVNLETGQPSFVNLPANFDEVVDRIKRPANWPKTEAPAAAERA